MPTPACFVDRHKKNQLLPKGKHGDRTSRRSIQPCLNIKYAFIYMNWYHRLWGLSNSIVFFSSKHSVGTAVKTMRRDCEGKLYSDDVFCSVLERAYQTLLTFLFG